MKGLRWFCRTMIKSNLGYPLQRFMWSCWLIAVLSSAIKYPHWRLVNRTAWGGYAVVVVIMVRDLWKNRGIPNKTKDQLAICDFYLKEMMACARLTETAPDWSPEWREAHTRFQDAKQRLEREHTRLAKQFGFKLRK